MFNYEMFAYLLTYPEYCMHYMHDILGLLHTYTCISCMLSGISADIVMDDGGNLHNYLIYARMLLVCDCDGAGIAG